MPDQHYDILIIGAGIVGLSTAMHVLRLLPDSRLLVVEKEENIAQHQSGHNSGVIHSGIYYKPGSLKARLCVEGAAAMLGFCQEHNIPYKQCGKLVIATNEAELSRLAELFARGQANGVLGLKMMDMEQMREVEPHGGGLRGLYVPGAAITDYGAVCRKYAEIVTSRGGTLVRGAKVEGLTHRDHRIVAETTSGAFAGRYVINCAGLHSDYVSRMAGQNPEVRIVPFRGEYYCLVPQREHLVRGLIYPVPDSRFPFLGVHFTPRIAGGVDAGPNAVLAFKREGYHRTDFNLSETTCAMRFPGFWRMAARYWRYGISEYHRSLSKRAFVKSLKTLVPNVAESDFVAGGSGVRAQAVANDGRLVDDFNFVRAKNILHVCNVPSPAATASLPIGRFIAEIAQEEIQV
ncbi:MAG: L-2-hydroxyglutarate oxidase [Acidobacteria bacterium]|nr:MAG: L-2-hydroxyglutarate oxidase [Acidobacteriota bacterium]PYV79927.1 MAG: L-2-hydroxyglutarate oxidase [Acidobacteriota bacterium]